MDQAKEVARVYLAGAIEFSPDKGVAWRKVITPKLREKNFSVFDPCKDENKILDRYNFSSSEEFHKSKITDPKRFLNCMRDIIKVDMAQVAMADAVLLYVDENMSKASGT